MILAGRITVNGEVVSLLGTRVDPACDVVAVDGVLITQPAKRTLLLHKPTGYITTRSDPRARDTVMSLVPAVPGLHPIGRLDKDTTGLLLLTNDGDLTYALTHPKHHVDKTYRARVRGIPTPRELAQLRRGILLEDGLTAPAQVHVITRETDDAWVEITIHEGRKRQVRYMFAAVGHPVLALARVSLGPLQLGDLPQGAWRDLTAEELQRLYAATGVEQP